MNNIFKVKKINKIIELTYIFYQTDNHTFKMNYEDSLWLNSIEQCRDFIKYIIELHNKLIEKIGSDNLDYKKIVRMHLIMIESIHSGLDVRSDWSIDKLADVLIESYNRKYKEAKEKCNNTINDLKTNPVHYGKKWRLFDKCNELNEIFELGNEPIQNYCTSTFSKDLKKMNELATKMLDTLIENNKNK